MLLQFIKIGQQFSTRVDVLSPEFVKELEKLQVCVCVACVACTLIRKCIAEGRGAAAVEACQWSAGEWGGSGM